MATLQKEYEYSPVAGSEEKATFIIKDDSVKIQPLEMAEDKKNAARNRKFLYISACVVNLAAFVCGTSFGWTSPEIPKFRQLPELGNPLPEPITLTEESWVGSLLPIGATLGPFIAGFTADKLGRKKSLLLGTTPFIVAFLMAALGSSLFTMYFMRFLCGLGVGVVFTVLPMYVGEIAEDAVRDTLGSFMQLFIVVGLLFSFIVGPYTTVAFFNYACVVFPVVFILLYYFFIPESPYFLVRKNKDEAGKALMKLRCQSQDEIQAELEEIKKSVEQSLANKASFLDIFKSQGLTKALIICLSLVSFQQLSGINIVLFYAQTIFIDAGSTIPPEISTIIIGVVQVLASGSTPLIVEKKGKKFLLILSGIGMALSQGVLAIFFIIKSNGNDVSNIAWLPVLSLVSYIITYCIGFGPLPWAVMGELFPGNVKSAASTATASVCWLLGFIVTKYFGFVTALIGIGGSFGIFAICCVVAAVFVHIYVPDTSGKSLQEIQDILEGRS